MAFYDRAIVRMLPAVPRPVVKRLSSRYIAGETMADAEQVVRELNARGKTATIDVLGEEIRSAAETEGFVRAYLDVLAEIERAGIDANVSVKPTALGLKLSTDLCFDNLGTVVSAAGEHGRFVRIDMEDSSTTSDTLALYRRLREDGIDNVGVVLQAALRRTLADIDGLADLRPWVRLCKGIYLEPESIAYQDYDAVRASFVQALDALLETGARVAIATHDDYLLEQSKRALERHGLGRDDYEFQFLLGVRPEVGDALVRDGHRLRIYVPFGSHWYEYSLRRLQENPKLAGYIAADTIGRLVPGRRAA
ncbi:MAG TPA: proline dehydrogenase family protein [Gaiellaceae bacterium]|nr:proline dehydrogenase family protein [Gaiellaceae bacterium]